jgi:hypothetical protein
MTSRIIEQVTNPYDLGRLLRGLAPAEPEEERVPVRRPDDLLVISRPGERWVTWAVGLTGWHSSFLGLDLEARRAVVVLTNTGLHYVDFLGFHLLDPTVPMPEARESEGVR